MTNKLPLALAMLLVLIAGVAVLMASRLPAVPECALLLGEDQHPAPPFAEATPDTPVRLQVRAAEALHVWVASWSGTDGTLALFPTPWLQTSVKNPLPSGTNLLPGRHGDKELAWPVRPVPGVTHYLAVASRASLPDLDATFAILRQVSNTTLPDGSMVVTAPKGRTLDDVPAREKIAGPLLELAASVTGASGRTPMRPVPGREGVWVASFQLVPPPAK